jgi:uncharacterized delta-60 repeat protein
MTYFACGGPRRLGLALLVLFGGLVPVAAVAQDHLDPSFGINGEVITPFNLNNQLGGIDQPFGLAVRPSDGKIVLAGICGWAPGDTRFCLARYNTNGALDSTFGAGGQVVTDMGAGSGPHVAGVGFQTSGKIIVAGDCFSDYCLARYNNDGTLDSTFDGDGKVFTDIGVSGVPSIDAVSAMTILSDDRILVVANTSDGLGNPYYSLARYGPNGSLDASFGSGGKVLIPQPVSPNLNPTSVAGDGSVIYVGGTCGALLCAVRLTNAGAVDTGYGTQGYVSGNLNDPLLYGASGDAIAIQNGKLLVIGSCDVPSVGKNFCMARFNSDGSLDTGFGNTSSTTDNWAYFNVLNNNDQATELVLRPDNSFLVAGTCVDLSFHPTFCMASFDMDANSEQFWVTTVFTTRADTVTSMALQADGNVVVAGFCEPAFGDDDFCVARYGDTVTLLTPTVTTQIHNTSHNVVTTIFTTQTVHDAVTVSGTGATPTGIVLIDWFTNGTCTGSPAATSTGQALIIGFIDASGFAQAPLTAGSYGFQARYTGDAVYTPGTGACEVLTVVDLPKTTPTVSSQVRLFSDSLPVSGAVIVGTKVYDFVQVTGGGPIATGQVTVSWFTNDSCRGRAAAVSSPGILDSDTGSIAYMSFAQTPTKRGPYAFQAAYLGDASYNPATGPCEPLNVVAKLTPTITTTIHDDRHVAVTSVQVNDTVHAMVVLPRVTDLAPTGTVTIQFFTNGTCKGKGSQSAPTALTVDNAGNMYVDATSFGMSLLKAGSYSFNAIYNGDVNFLPATGACAPVQATP